MLPPFPFSFVMNWWDQMPFFFLIFSFKLAFSFSYFTLIKRFFSSSVLSVIRMVSSAYLRLLIFFLAILILACDSSSLAFCMTHSACKLNRKGDNKQLYRIAFSIPNQSVVTDMVLTWSTHSFLKRQSHLWVSHSLLWSTQSKALTSQWNRGRCFSGIPLLSLWSSKFWQFDLWFLCLF